MSAEAQLPALLFKASINIKYDGKLRVYEKPTEEDGF